MPVIQALQTLRGVAEVTAATIVAEVSDFSRFRHPAQLMSYTGLVPREYSSGQGRWQGGLTETGNAHLRRVVVEAAWSYRHRPALKTNLKKRQEGGIAGSMGRVGDTLADAPQESFLATRQKELIDRHRWETRRTLKSAIFEYVEAFCNGRRHHSALGYVGPAEFERRWTGAIPEHQSIAS